MPALNRDQINQFLWYGYRIDGPPRLPFSLAAPDDGALLREAGLDELIAIGAARWRQAIAACLAEGSGPNVVPLSGGLDSRAILGGLLEHFPASQVNTFTFGMPGTWDYEIGNLVAAAMGTRHTTFDLTRQPYTVAGLAGMVRGMGFRTHALSNGPMPRIAQQYGIDSRHWHGFMGDPLAGGHLLAVDSATWPEARRRFADDNRLVRRTNLASPDFDPLAPLPEMPLMEPGLLSYDAQLDFAVRQHYFIRPIIEYDGLAFQAPYIQPAWVSFMLHVPRTYRVDRRLHKRILRSIYPALFALPTKSNFALPLAASPWAVKARLLGLRLDGARRRLWPAGPWPPRPMTNYLDHDLALRQHAGLKAIAFDSLLALKQYGVVDWLDIDAMWRAHQSGKANHGAALALLTSLAFVLELVASDEPTSN